MYKLVFFLFMLLLASCNSSNFSKRVDILEFKYKEHYYLRFKSPMIHGAEYLHSPDCPCHDKYLLLWQR